MIYKEQVTSLMHFLLTGERDEIQKHIDPELCDLWFPGNPYTFDGTESVLNYLEGRFVKKYPDTHVQINYAIEEQCHDKDKTLELANKEEGEQYPDWDKGLLKIHIFYSSKSYYVFEADGEPVFEEFFLTIYYSNGKIKSILQESAHNKKFYYLVICEDGQFMYDRFETNEDWLDDWVVTGETIETYKR